MEFPLEIEAPALTSDPAPNPPVSVNQAGADAEAEYAKMISDPKHQHYDGLRRGDKAAEEYANSLFRKAYGTAPVPIDSEEVSSTTGEAPDDAELRARTEVMLDPLRREWGADCERRVAMAQAGLYRLFEGQGEILADLCERVYVDYGPKGEAAVLKLFAELEDIKQGGMTS